MPFNSAPGGVGIMGENPFVFLDFGHAGVSPRTARGISTHHTVERPYASSKGHRFRAGKAGDPYTGISFRFAPLSQLGPPVRVSVLAKVRY